MSGAPARAPSHAGIREALLTWARIGLLSFGGPTAQIAVMHRILVDEKRWFAEAEFLDALGFCMLLPGPEAMQLATWSGWKLHGVRGGLAAGLLFVLPGAIVMLALASLYLRFGALPAAGAIFLGVKAAVLAIVLEAMLRMSRRAIHGRADTLIAAATFVAVFFFGMSFPLVIAAAAAFGMVRGAGQITRPATPERVSIVSTARTLAFGVAMWLAPLLVLELTLGPHDIVTQVGVFFTRLAVVTFGGAYAVLTYMAQDVVTRHGWLDARQMIDGLGLAETTPGPLILVGEFVGYVAGARAGGTVTALACAGITLWATFAPCFVWIFTGAPWLAWISAQPRLRGALAAITAAVAGVILQLAVWFAIHTWFAKVLLVRAGPLQLWTPQPASVDGAAIALSAIAAALVFWRRWPMLRVLATMAVLGALARLVWAAP